MLEQAGQQIVDRGVVDLVIVVQHQDQPPVQLADGVDETDDVLPIGADFALEDFVEMAPAERRNLFLDGRKEVRHESAGIGIQAIDLEPRDGVAPSRRELGH